MENQCFEDENCKEDSKYLKQLEDDCYYVCEKHIHNSPLGQCFSTDTLSDEYIKKLLDWFNHRSTIFIKHIFEGYENHIKSLQTVKQIELDNLNKSIEKLNKKLSELENRKSSLNNEVGQLQNSYPALEEWRKSVSDKIEKLKTCINNDFTLKKLYLTSAINIKQNLQRFYSKLNPNHENKDLLELDKKVAECYSIIAVSLTISTSFSSISNSSAGKFGLIYYYNFRDTVIEKWSFTFNTGQAYLLKLVKSSDSSKKEFIKKEINFLRSVNTENGVYCKVQDVYETNESSGYITSFYEQTVNDMIEKKVIFKEEEIRIFLLFISSILESIRHLDIFYLDPTQIAIYKGRYILTDFRYDRGDIEKYRSPEIIENLQITQGSCFIYSAGLISLELLGVNTLGLNKPQMSYILQEKIASLSIRRDFKDLLEEMLRPNRNDRITRLDFITKTRRFFNSSS